MIVVHNRDRPENFEFKKQPYPISSLIKRLHECHSALLISVNNY